ncbi:hypothetical protein [Chitinimonas arctica]|uniref:hypothetical protein n=1 Tax=Chitinimonas arctica TaxID=2594795 RepID=UPI001CC75A37|nr:hypothetical protein [Chitinimonas arctica]
MGGVGGQHVFQHIAAGDGRGPVVQVDTVVDGHGTRLAGPRNRLEGAVERQQLHIRVAFTGIFVIGPVAGGGLDGDGAAQPQFLAGGEAGGGHGLAAREAVDIRHQAFHLAHMVLL